MKLNYRGISYEHNPAEIAVDEGKVGGKFRGCNWRVHNLKHAPVVKHFSNLIYRGAPVN
ncbi:MAG: DUF4278 domain-containing protein [Cyanobacteria bacterium P01_G01_bin.19]